MGYPSLQTKIYVMFTNEIMLDKTIQDNPHVLKIVDEGKIKTRNLGGPLEDPHRWHNH